MKAAVLRCANKPLSLEELELLPPREGEVSVRFAASGVCHSDLSRIEGKRKQALPIVLGHEAAGVIEAVGPGVTNVAPGDHVVLSFLYDCGRCFFCSIGKPNLCEIGLSMLRDGVQLDGTTRLRKGDEVIHHMVISSFGERGVVPARCATRIPKDVPLHVAALIGCGVLTGTGSVFNTSRVTAGSTVLVIGAGGVGLNVIQACSIVGASVIAVADISDSKLEMARKFGATHFINAKTENVVDKAKELSSGRGVDYAFEVIGNPATIRQIYDAIRPAGTAVVVGLAPQGTCCEVDASVMPLTEKVVMGSMYGSFRPVVDIERLVRMYQAKELKLDELVTKTYRLDQINDALHDLHGGTLARGVIRYD